MNKDSLMNIRANIINGNRKHAYQDIKEYGFQDFPIDYLEQLEDQGFSKELAFEELRDALYLMKYHYNREA